MNNREAFEAWAEKELYALDKREGSDRYRNVITRNAWLGWNAALASQQQDHIPDVGKMVEVSEHGEGQENDCQECGDEAGSSCSSDEGIEYARKVHETRQSQAKQDQLRDTTKMMQGCKECDGQTYMHSPTGEYLGECPYCTKEQDPYAYDVPTEDGTELAYAGYYGKYKNKLPEGAIPLYLQSQVQQEPNKDVNEAIILLSAVFDAWENGTDCYDDFDGVSGSFIGKAFNLDDEIFKRCCDLLNRVNPPRNASQAQQTESQWKPIATAPKNKKIIVRYKNVCDKDRTVFAKYIEEFTEEANSETECETDYHEERDTYYFKEGWVEMIDNWDEFSCVYFDSRNVPTHWMDIPPAP